MITGKNNELAKTSGASANGVYSKRYADYSLVTIGLCMFNRERRTVIL